MPGSTPPTSQLDWLSSTTAMIVLSWSKAMRDLLKSFSWGLGGTPSVICQRRWCHLLAACPIPSHRWREQDSTLRSPVREADFLGFDKSPTARPDQPRPLPGHDGWSNRGTFAGDAEAFMAAKRSGVGFEAGGKRRPIRAHPPDRRLLAVGCNDG